MANISEGRIKKFSICFCYILVLLLKISFVYLFNIKNLRNLISHNSEIYLIIQGNETQNILSNDFYIEPSKVYVNGVQDISCKKTCYLKEDENNITLNFSSQLISFENMFLNLDNIIEVDLSNFDTSLITTMSSMFKNCYNLVSVNLSNSTTNSLINMSYMFNFCSSLEIIDFGNINTSLVEDMKYLFSGCSSIQSIDISQFDTSKVTNMSFMFHNCSILENINLSYTDTSSVEDMRYLFSGCSSIPAIDISQFDTSKVTIMIYMFYNCSSLEVIDFITINTSLVEDMQYLFSGCLNIQSIDISQFDTSKITNMINIFHNCKNLKTLNLSNINTSLVKDMRYIFSECSNIQSIDISQFDTRKVTNMIYMFYNCSSLTSINFGNINTSLVEDMNHLFSGCLSIQSLDISQFDTSKVKNMGAMFYNCINLTSINFGNINTSSVKYMGELFNNCNNLYSINLSFFDTSQVTIMKNMFNGCSSLVSINLSSFDTSKVTDMRWMFQNCKMIKTIDLTNINTSSINSLYSFFNGCFSLVSIDLSSLDTSKVVDMSYMLQNCRQLKTINFGNINTSSLKNMNSLFAYCLIIESIDISRFDTSKVIDMFHTFGRCQKLTSLNFGNINTSSLKNLRSLFYESLQISSLDFSSFDTSQVTSFQWMFYNCHNLRYVNLSNFNTSSATTIYQMFSTCVSLIYVNLDLFKLDNKCNTNEVFLNVPKYVKYCVNDNKTKYLLEEKNSIPICSDTCNDVSKKKIDLSNNTCIESCLNIELHYEYKSMCYEICPINTYIIFGQVENNVNSIECFVPSPEGYYLDLIGKFKKCYELCKYCFGDGNETYNNCIECKKDYSFYVNLNNITNCYRTCNNYYFFNETNNFGCTNNLECPEKYKKLIREKNKCIDICENDDIYKYEYNNICYIESPDNTITNDTHKYICYEPIILTTIIAEYSDSHSPSEKLFSNSIPYYFSEYSEHSILTNKDSNFSEYTELTTIINSDLIEYTDSVTNTNSEYYDINLITYKQTEYPESSLIVYNSSDYSTQYIAPVILINNENITQKLIKPSSSSSSQSQIIYECDKGDETNDNCGFVGVKNETVILDIIKENIQSLINQETGKSQVIKGENEVVYQITNAKNEKELLKGESLNNQNLTIIDLGECETKLKKEYHINENDSLIYLKQEKINAHTSKKDIQYEVFEPYNFTKLNMSICDEEKVNVYFPIQLSVETKETYEKMKSLGYDMLDINSPFYQDICIPFKTENNTDIPLSARKDYIYNNKDSQCQPGCHFSSYLPNSFYINCSCTVKEEKHEGEQKFTEKKLYESFYDILKYANFKILKCYNLTLNKNVFKNNFGNIIILVIFVIYFICLISYMIKGIEPLKHDIKELNDKAKEINDSNNKFIFNNIKIENKNNNKHSKKNINKNSNKNTIYKNKIYSNPKKKKNSKKINPDKNNENIKRKKNKSKTKILKKSHLNEEVLKYRHNFDKKIEIIKNNFSLSSKNRLEDLTKKDNINKLQSLNQEKEKKEEKKLDAFELNQLEYEEAIIYDKRIFIKTYWDILCREHKIIFTFFICNDHNLLYIKYARFLFLFATDMAMNVFFFSDESMNKIFLNYGKYNFFQQIPQIIYTTIISQLIEVFLCYLSLTDKHVYQIKNLTKTSDRKEILSILKCIKIKLFGFFVFTFVFFGFYWYTVSSFCGVYENTQITFLKDSLLSFLLGILYPIAIYLIPSALRICALRNAKRNLKCIYKLSDIIPFF